jgi:hypothetical protein
MINLSLLSFFLSALDYKACWELTSASSPALYASKVLARCCLRDKEAEEDSAIMTSAIFIVYRFPFRLFLYRIFLGKTGIYSRSKSSEMVCMGG